MENFPWGRSNVWEREGAHSDSGSGPGEERGVEKVMWLCLLICEVPPPPPHCGIGGRDDMV